MAGAGFHFAQPGWLWLLVVPLLVWIWPFRGYRAREDLRWGRYADSHLLPHLMISGAGNPRRRRRQFWIWALVWLLGTLALAGPRWDFTDIRLFQPGSDVVVLLDVSASMNAADVQPSRIARARQEIEDLVEKGRGLRVGLIAFASVAHVVTPVTEDAQTLRHMLPYLGSELVHLPGSRVEGALERARRLLAGQPTENSRSIVLVTDGDFDRPDLVDQVSELHASGITLHVIGVGSSNGGPVPDAEGRWIMDRDGKQVISRLAEDVLGRLAQAGGGLYRRADFRESDTDALVEAIVADAPTRERQGSRRVWNEHFSLLLILMLLLLIPGFQRGKSAVARVGKRGR